MYLSKKKEDGTYSLQGFISRALELINPRLLAKYTHEYLPTYGLWKRIAIYLDYYSCLVLYGTIIADYFEYAFWEKRACVRREYITMKMNKRIKKVFNHEPLGIFRNKMLFNEKFAEYRNLLHFDFSKQDETAFLQFVEQCHKNIIVKPLSGYSGLGIRKPDVSTNESCIALYNELKQSGEYFCEETFVQDGVLRDVNPTSLNTVRIYTIHDGNRVHVTSVCIRFGGKDACVDNIHAGGMCCAVDIETGVIMGPGYNLSGKKTYYHPVSGIFLPGIRIPNWENVLSMIENAAMKFPQQGHIAWDVAVSENKISIIEGNDGGNFDVPQVCMQEGMKPQYDVYLANRMKK